MTNVGGQALIEGILFKSPTECVIGIRKPNGKIKVKKEKCKSITEKHKSLGWPFIRGPVILFETLVIGFKALSYSAEEQLEDESEKEDEKITGWALFFTLFLSLFIALLLFKFLPLVITKYVFRTENGILFNLIDGVLKIGIFILYVWVISLMEDMKRVFQYHGAEHKTVACFEAKKKLTVKNVKKFSTLHPRCGTSFIMLVLIIAIFVYSLVPIDIPFYLLFLVRIPLLIPIAAISYELLRLSGKFKTSWILKPLILPGLWIQKITTKEPDKKQIEVAISAFVKLAVVKKSLSQLK